MSRRQSCRRPGSKRDAYPTTQGGGEDECSETNAPPGLAACNTLGMPSKSKLEQNPYTRSRIDINTRKRFENIAGRRANETAKQQSQQRHTSCKAELRVQCCSNLTRRRTDNPIDARTRCIEYSQPSRSSAQQPAPPWRRGGRPSRHQCSHRTREDSTSRRPSP